MLRAQMMLTKVMTSVDTIVVERYLKETEGLEKLNFTNECIVIVAIS